MIYILKFLIKQSTLKNGFLALFNFAQLRNCNYNFPLCCNKVRRSLASSVSTGSASALKRLTGQSVISERIHDPPNKLERFHVSRVSLYPPPLHFIFPAVSRLSRYSRCKEMRENGGREGRKRTARFV